MDDGEGGGGRANDAARWTPDAGSVGLYVHWPFCLAKCPYCDFNSHVRDSVDQDRWRRALLSELAHFAAALPGRRLTSIFFGGGTPSLMPPATAARLVERATTLWTPADDVEITLEANPTSTEAALLRDFRAAGVNRLSLGVQALDDGDLAMLGRGHSAREALAAVDLAGRLFPRHSFDLIYARPGQSPAAWRRELAAALDHAGGHVSAYRLTIEKGTPFYAAARRGALSPPDEATAAALYEVTRTALDGAGLPAYEISNHARPGEECRHNLTYWLSGDFVGIGPGAHGRLTDGAGVVATEQRRAPEAWLAAAERDGHATRRRRRLDREQRLMELLLMGLRLAAGIPRAVFRRAVGAAPEEALDRARLDRLAGGGFLVLDDAGLRATAAGRRRLDAVLAELCG